MQAHDDPNLGQIDNSDSPLIPQAGPLSPSISTRYGEEEESDFDPAFVLKVLHKRRWVVLTIVAVVMTITAIATLSAVPVFRATAEVLIEKEDSNVVAFEETVEQERSGDYYQTQYRLLRSRAIARRTMDSLGLWNEPRFYAAPAKPTAVRRLASVARDLFKWSPGRGPSAETTTAASSNSSADAQPGNEETHQEAAKVDALLGALSIDPVPNTRIVEVTFRSGDPDVAARVANGVARAYIDQNLEFKFLATKEAADWLGERLAEQREKVNASEQALQSYRESNGAIALDASQNIVVQKLSEVNAAVTQAKMHRIAMEGLYRQLAAIRSDRAALDTFPVILSNSFIQQQKGELASLQRQLSLSSERLGDKHPEIVKLRTSIEITDTKLQGEVAKVVESVHNQYLTAKAQEDSLNAVLQQHRSEALAMNRKGINYGVLLRDAESNRQIYESLLNRTKETGISGELKTSNVRIVDPAEVPRWPESPNRRRSLLLGLLIGLALGAMAAVGFETLDNRIKTPDDVKHGLNVPFLGMIPLVAMKEGTTPMVHGNVVSGFAESFRAVRTNLLFSSTSEGPRSVVVTSTAPGEGKTSVACNLAVALAQMEQRVLLIDADMRKPRVHTVFGKAQEPGLSNVLVGNAKASEALLRGPHNGLWIMPAGLHPPNPAELLGSRRFKDFLQSLDRHFDWVIVDSPPVMVVTDASLIAHLTRSTLFVVGADMTSRYAAKRAIEQLRLSQAQGLVAVLNRVNLERNSYYYSQYYRAEYAEYYVKGA